MRDVQIFVVGFIIIGMPVIFLISEIWFPHKPKQKTVQQLPPLYSSVQPATRKPEQKAKPVKNDPDIIAALYAQADAELLHADALEKKAKTEKDPVKQAALIKRAAACRTKSNQLSFKAYNMQSSE